MIFVKYYLKIKMLCFTIAWVLPIHIYALIIWKAGMDEMKPTQWSPLLIRQEYTKQLQFPFFTQLWQLFPPGRSSTNCTLMPDTEVCLCESILVTLLFCHAEFSTQIIAHRTPQGTGSGNWTPKWDIEMSLFLDTIFQNIWRYILQYL